MSSNLHPPMIVIPLPVRDHLRCTSVVLTDHGAKMVPDFVIEEAVTLPVLPQTVRVR